MSIEKGVHQPMSYKSMLIWLRWNKETYCRKSTLYLWFSSIDDLQCLHAFFQSYFPLSYKTISSCCHLWDEMIMKHFRLDMVHKKRVSRYLLVFSRCNFCLLLVSWIQSNNMSKIKAVKFDDSSSLILLKLKLPLCSSDWLYRPNHPPLSKPIMLVYPKGIHESKNGFVREGNVCMSVGCGYEKWWTLQSQLSKVNRKDHVSMTSLKGLQVTKTD